MIHRRLILAACAIAMLLAVVQPVHAAPFWDDSFEHADTAAWLSAGTWIGSSCVNAAGHAGIMEISSTRAYSGTKSLKFTYIGINPPKTCYLDRHHTRVPELYTRRYVFLDGFTATSAAPSKQMFTGEAAYVNFWSVFEGSSNLHRYNLQGSTLPAQQQNPILGNIPVGKWVCIETRTKMNTPGVANGILEEWVDGLLRYSNTALLINAASQNSQHSFVRLYRQHGNGVIYLDNIAVGNTKIGCLGSQTGDTTAPGPVLNFRVN